MLKRLIDKTNCSRIWIEHLKTLDILDKVFFFGLPAFISSIFVYGFKIEIKDEFYTNLGTAYSVFSAILLTFLVISFEMALQEKNKEHDKQNNLKKELLEEVVPNVGFTILISLAGLILVLLHGIKIESPTINSIGQINVSDTIKYVWATIPQMIEFCHVYIATLFILSFLMVLKRLYCLLLSEVKKK